MSLILVILLIYSILLTQVFLFWISTRRMHRLLWFRPHGIRSVSFCVVLCWRRRRIYSWVHYGPVRISGTVAYDSTILGFIRCFLLSELDEVLNNWRNQCHQCRNNNSLCLAQPTQLEKSLILNSLENGCAPEAPSTRSWGTLLVSWLNSSLPGRLTLQTSWASFIAECIGRMCWSLLMAVLKY